MKLLNSKKGFTLIEVLIVVVIIGILASLILPRMLAQPERAVTAEALNYLGVIRRAQETNAQPSGGYTAATSGDPNLPSLPNAAWTALGLQPLAPSTNFTYSCTAGAIDVSPPAAGAAVCTATRIGPAAGARFNGTIGMGVANGFITACGGPAGTAYTLQGTADTSGAQCI